MTEAFVQDAYPSFHYAKKMISELFLFNLSFIVFRYKDMVIIMYEGWLKLKLKIRSIN